MDTAADYYTVLGVKRGATADEIKRAYRLMVFRYHPDRNPGNRKAADKFKEVLDAYAVLADSPKRAAYDAETNPEGSEARSEDHQKTREERTSGNGFGSHFGFGREFNGTTEPQPRCPSCSAPGTDHIVSRKGGSSAGRGKQFIAAPFNVVFCDACGHVYGVTATS